MRILVADDDRGVKRGIALMLRTHGYEVDEAADGSQALSFLRRHEYGIVITDLAMPGCNGMTVLRWVEEHSPDTCRVLMTSNHDSAILRDARLLTDGRVLRKPCSLEAIEETLGPFISESRTASA